MRAGTGRGRAGIPRDRASTTDAETYRGRASRLVTSPVLASPLYIRTDSGQMFALAANGRWVGAGLEPGLRSPTFVG